MTRPETIAEVIARMREVGASLPRGDGVACFNRLYLAVTEAVEEAAAESRFQNERFLAHLDVAFAALYFDALRGPTPRAWVPLLDARRRQDIAPIQFAFAGMNAHINRDLPVALVATWEALSLEPRRGGPEHDDFLLVNELLERTEQRVKREFSRGLVGLADRVLGRLDDVVAIWNVARARDAAWTNAETLWELRRSPYLRDDFLLALDRMVGFAGRGLLVPVARAGPVARLRRVFGRFFGRR